MRRFLTLFVTPILGIIVILVKLPEIDKWVRENTKNGAFLIALVLVGSTLLIHFITVVSPFKKYEKLEKNKWILIDNITSDFLGNKLFPGNNVVANVMTPKRVFYCKLEPCECKSIIEKIICFWRALFVKRLKPIWLSTNHTLDKRFKITINQGVSGRAFSLGKVAIIDIPNNINNLNLNDKQKEVISGNGFVVSYPIFALDEKYNRLGTKIIGVVTLSCSDLGAEELISSPENRNLLTEKIVDFSKICSLIL